MCSLRGFSGTEGLGSRLVSAYLDLNVCRIIMAFWTSFEGLWALISPTLRVQVPNNHILSQNLYCNYYYPNPTYLNIGYLDP